MSETLPAIPERFQPAYRTSGLKAPVIHAGDEKPFLVRALAGAGR
jgi:hypothetical protein